jgi:hypothetical protein
MQRAAAWISAYLPGYGLTEVGVESVDASGPVPAQRDLLVSWAPPGQSIQRFPDVSRHTVDVAENTDDFILKPRSTATQMYVHWMGGVDPEWGGTLRSDPEDPVRVEVDRSGSEVLRGSIISDLPGDLTGWTVIWIRSQRTPTLRYALVQGDEAQWVPEVRSGQMINLGRMARPGGDWSPGQRRQLLGMFDETRRGLVQENIYERYVREYERGMLGGSGSGSISHNDERKYMEMLSIFGQLEPPKYLKPAQGQSPDTMVARRSLGRELDLSPWFNRPCVIVIGFLEDSACPIPLRLDGRQPRSQGLTVVRWVFPLPLNDRIAFGIEADEPE